MYSSINSISFAGRLGDAVRLKNQDKNPAILMPDKDEKVKLNRAYQSARAQTNNNYSDQLVFEDAKVEDFRQLADSLLEKANEEYCNSMKSIEEIYADVEYSYKRAKENANEKFKHAKKDASELYDLARNKAEEQRSKELREIGSPVTLEKGSECAARAMKAKTQAYVIYSESIERAQQEKKESLKEAKKDYKAALRKAHQEEKRISKQAEQDYKEARKEAVKMLDEARDRSKNIQHRKSEVSRISRQALVTRSANHLEDLADDVVSLDSEAEMNGWGDGASNNLISGILFTLNRKKADAQKKLSAINAAKTLLTKGARNQVITIAAGLELNAVKIASALNIDNDEVIKGLEELDTIVDSYKAKVESNRLDRKISDWKKDPDAKKRYLNVSV